MHVCRTGESSGAFPLCVYLLALGDASKTQKLVGQDWVPLGLQVSSCRAPQVDSLCPELQEKASLHHDPCVQVQGHKRESPTWSCLCGSQETSWPKALLECSLWLLYDSHEVMGRVAGQECIHTSIFPSLHFQLSLMESTDKL